MIPMRMIDEASYQADFWTTARLKESGIQVVAVKATEGTGYLNPYYSEQVSNARGAACAIMHYHVAHPQESSSGEFDYFESHATAVPGDLVMIDMEPQFWTLPAATQSGWLDNFTTFCARKWPGVSPVVYVPGSLIADGSTESVRGRLPLFYPVPGASPDHVPAPPRAWLVSFLQYGDANGTDQDAAYFGDLAQLARLAIPLPARHPAPPAPAPAPAPKVTQGQAQSAVSVLGAYVAEQAKAGGPGAPDAADLAAVELLRQYVTQ